MLKNKELTKLLETVDRVVIEKKVDLSQGEDLSIALMNLISIEEHIFFTSQKTGKRNYLDLLNSVRSIRTELMGELVKNPEGEVWCISKHLLASSMRVMEVGTKELKKGNNQKAWSHFEKAYDLYNQFWLLNLTSTKDNNRQTTNSDGIKDKLKHLLDCCKE